MTRDELIAAALAFDGAVEDYPFGDDLLTVKVGGKVFVWVPLTESGWLGNGSRIAVKAPPAAVLELLDAYPEDVFGAPPLDHRHWVAVRFDRLEDSEIHELLAQSYAAVVAGLPRRRRPGTAPD